MRATLGAERELRNDLETALAQLRQELGAQAERGKELELRRELAEARSGIARAQNYSKAQAKRGDELAARLHESLETVARLQRELADAHSRIELAHRYAEAQELVASGEPGRVDVESEKLQTAPCCSVCRRRPDSEGVKQLREEYWIARNHSLLCPACQEDGWRFPPDAPFPVRRLSDRVSDQPDVRSASATAASDADTSRRA